MGYYAYKDGSSFYGINIRRFGSFGKPISKEQYEKLLALPNKGLKTAMVKKF
jgi:hypothetical protein